MTNATNIFHGIAADVDCQYLHGDNSSPYSILLSFVTAQYIPLYLIYDNFV